MNRMFSCALLAAAISTVVSTSAFAASASVCQSQAGNIIGLDPVNGMAYVPINQVDQSFNAQLAVVNLAAGAFPQVVQTISLPGAGGIFSIAYNALDQTMLVGALLYGTTVVNIYTIDTTASPLAADPPIGTTLLSGVGMVMDPIRNRAFISGANGIAVLDTSTTPYTFVTLANASSSADSITVNPNTGILVTSGNNTVAVIDTTQPLPWTQVNLSAGLAVTIGNSIAIDPDTNIALYTPSGYRDVTYATNFDTLAFPTSNTATADSLLIPGLGEGQNTIGGGPGGWLALNCETHQAAVVDPGGQNIKLVQLPEAPIPAAPDNNGQPYTNTTADADSAYTIADMLLATDPCGSGMTTGGGTSNQPVNVDPEHNQLYFKTGVGSVNTVQYLVDVDLSSPVFGACPTNAYKNGPDTGVPCTNGQWTPRQSEILLPGPAGCTAGHVTPYLGQYQGAALETNFSKSLEVEVLLPSGAAALGSIVTFTAPTPADGPSGTFTTTGTNVAQATVNAQGIATAPPFTANDTPGGYLVTATVPNFTVPAYFEMTNFGNTVSVTVKASVAGALVSLDGSAGANSITQTLTVGSVHTISTTSPQTVGGVRYGWDNWSDGQAQSHPIVILGPDTYTANFVPTYVLTISATTGGEVTPNTGNYYNAAEVVPITATPFSGYVFTGWTGSVANPSIADTTVTMNGPETVVANFGVATTFSISPTSVNVTASAGNGTVMVTAPSGSSAWVATSNSSFLTITSGSSGSGNGTVAYSVAANIGGARTGTLTIAGLTFTVNQAAGSVTGLGFYPVTPCRVADTRTGQGFSGQFGPPSLAAGGTRNFPIPSSGCNIPSTAQAFSLNITVVPRTVLGYLTIWPTGQSQPVVSTLNSQNGATLANAAIVPAGVGGQVSVFVTDTIDLIIDINGYFAAPSSSSLAFYPVTPCRVADTRTGSGQFGAPSLPASGIRSFIVPQSNCGIPATAKAYSLNMTVVPPAPLIYLTTWPTGSAQPVVSTLNALQGQIAANAAIVPAGTNGAISVFVSNASNVIIDINGYFAPPGSPGALNFYPVTPCRVADTRTATGNFGGPSLPAGGTRTFPVPTSNCGLPSTAQAYSFNMTVVPAGPLLYLTTWPAGLPQPVVSTLNDQQGLIVANAAIVPAGTSPAGGVSVFVSDASNVIIDVNGYFGQ